MCKVNVNLGIFKLEGYKSDRTMINEIRDDKKDKLSSQTWHTSLKLSNTERNTKKTEKIDEE